MAKHQVKVELFGIPRHRAGVAEFFVEVNRMPCALRDVFDEVEKRFPDLATELFDDRELRKEFVVNIAGERFTRSMDFQVLHEQSVLILSSDAGG